MDSRSPTSHLCLHRETRLNLDPLFPSSIVHFQLPSSSSFSRQTRTSRKVYDTLPASRTEEDFRRRHVATASSIYFRNAKLFPRSILWRVLEDGHVLELRSLDLTKEQEDKRQSRLTLRFQFASAIQNEGVVLAGAEDSALSVFVVTKNYELHTFALRSDFFCSLAASESDAGRWYKVAKPLILSTGALYRFTAASSLELLVTLSDGRLARLVRQQGDGGSNWSELLYSEVQWRGSLRKFNPWHDSNTVRHEGTTFERISAIAASLSPDKLHIVTVCLNHTLRFWSIATGKPAVTKDLLDVERDPQEEQRMTINPGTPKVLEVFEAQTIFDRDLYYVMTYSPHSNGVFKFWAVQNADRSENGVRSLFKEHFLRAPDPDDGALWTVLDFKVRSVPGEAGIDVWITMRLNRRCRIYHRKFPDFQNLGPDWDSEWSVTSIDGSQEQPFAEPPMQPSPRDPRSVSDRWLEFLFTPWLIPEPALETALHVFASSQQVAVPSSKHSLKERLAACVGTRTTLEASEDILDGAEEMCDELNSQWINYWQCVQEIEKARSELMSLSFDAALDMPWIVTGDGCYLIRECSDIEVLAYNTPRTITAHEREAVLPSIESEDGLDSDLGQASLSALLGVAAGFRAGFAQSLRFACEEVVDSELWQEPSTSVAARIRSFYRQCRFRRDVGDKQYEELKASLDAVGGIDGVTTERFLAVVAMISCRRVRMSTLSSTKFGLRALLRGVQDSIALHSRILHDLLYLTVFLEVDTDQEEDPLEEFDACEVYVKLLGLLQEVELSRWLASHTRPERPEDDADLKASASPTRDGSIVRSSTVVEDRFAGVPPPQSTEDQSQSAAFTKTIRGVLFQMRGIDELDLDAVRIHVQANFLKLGNIDLAVSFARFMQPDPLSTYLHARLCLLQEDFTPAAIYFKKAAYALCKPPYALSSLDLPNPALPARPAPPSDAYKQYTSGLIDDHTAPSLAHGLTAYYAHVADLFQAARCHPQIAAFAQLALLHQPPAPARADLLARLFHAALALADYPAAYSALARYADRALQRAALASLITAMRDARCLPELLAWPFLGLARDVDALLAARARDEARAAVEDPTAARAAWGPLGVAPVPWFRVLHAWRLRRGDTRGAAAVLVQRLEDRRARAARAARKTPMAVVGGGAARDGDVGLDEYLEGINALALCGDAEEEGWVFVDGEEEGKKRRVVRLTDLRETYQREMDRAAMLDMGRYGLVGDDEDAEMGEPDVGEPAKKVPRLANGHASSRRDAHTEGEGVSA